MPPNRDNIAIVEFLEKQLKYCGSVPKLAIEAGALDGIIGSNIRAFLEDGWRGVWIEPCPDSFEKLEANSVGLDVRLVQAAISDKSKHTATFYYHENHPGGSSLIHPDDRPFPEDRRPLYKDDNTYEVECMTLQEMLTEEESKNVTILSLDLEDMDTRVLRQIIYRSEIRPLFIVVEGRDMGSRIGQCQIVHRDYTKVWGAGSNQIFKRDD